jgi:hypothetical protein
VYQSINQNIYQLFLEKSIGMNYFILAFDDNDLGTISAKLEISTDKIISIILDNEQNKNWQIFLEEINGLPQSFGIIALQVLCASRMEKTVDYSANTYIKIIEKLFNISNIQLIYNKFQDKLWSKLKTYIESLNYKTIIPNPRKNKGRYIQYPISQVYLNKNDLKYFSGYFANKDLKPNQAIVLEDFISILGIENDFYSVNNQYITNHFKQIINRETFQFPIAQQQIHNKYITWKGSEFRENHIQITPNVKLYCEVFQDEYFTFYIKKNKIVEINNTKLTEELLRYKVITKTTEFLILRIPEGKWDFEDVRKVKMEDDVIIIVFDNNSDINDELNESNIISRKLVISECQLFKFNMNEIVSKSNLWERIISKSRNNILSLKSGYRLLRNKFLINHGPKFLIKKDLRISINKESKNFKNGQLLDFTNYKKGNYEIIITGAHKFKIQICVNVINTVIKKPTSGWNISEYKPIYKPFDLFGLTLQQTLLDNSTKSFLKVSILKQKINTNNQILKTLSRLN